MKILNASRDHFSPMNARENIFSSKKYTVISYHTRYRQKFPGIFLEIGDERDVNDLWQKNKSLLLQMTPVFLTKIFWSYKQQLRIHRLSKNCKVSSMFMTSYGI